MAVGYDPDFLPGERVDLPKPATKEIEKDLAPTKQDDPVRNYTHFSLAMSASAPLLPVGRVEHRRERPAAAPPDGAQVRPRRRVRHEVPDRRRPVRPTTVSTAATSRGAPTCSGGRGRKRSRRTVDSFFFTNITPQIDDFNQSGKHGLWGELEDAIFENVDVESLRVSLFGGPIFKDGDFPVPRHVRAALVLEGDCICRAREAEGAGVRADAGRPGVRRSSFGLEQFNLYQVAIGDLTGMTGLDFGGLPKVDTIAAHPGVLAPGVRRIDARSQIAAG